MTAPKTILFVDDDRDFLLAQRAFFASRGFAVITAETREAALAALEQTRPDVIILDLMMEHYDSGFTLAHRIRKEPGTSSVPIIMLSGVAASTGHRFGGEAQQLKEWTHLDAFLDKPVTGRQLLKVIEEGLARHQEPEHGSAT